jgi:uroporphyrinogen III methyltransferase/synthase
MSTLPVSSSVERDRPLAGLRIVLTRPREQAGDFEETVRALGGIAEIAPAIAITPPDGWEALDAALDRVDDFDWIAFTSANAVHAFLERAHSRGIPSSRVAARKLGVLGHATAAMLAEALRDPDAIAEAQSAAGLGEALPAVEGQRILIPHGDRAGHALAAALRGRGAEPTEVVAYRTIPGEGIPSIVAGLREGSIDALLFASGSAVEFLADALATSDAIANRTEPGVRAAIFCIGPGTARAAESAGFATDGIASEATQRALIDVMVRRFAGRRTGSS